MRFSFFAAMTAAVAVLSAPAKAIEIEDEVAAPVEDFEFAENFDDEFNLAELGLDDEEDYELADLGSDMDDLDLAELGDSDVDLEELAQLGLDDEVIEDGKITTEFSLDQLEDEDWEETGLNQLNDEEMAQLKEHIKFVNEFN